MNRFLVVISAILTLGCQSTKDEIVKNFPHSISPDKSIVVYQVTSKENTDYRLSLTAWFDTPLGNGGAGLLDLFSTDPDTLQLEWTSDSTIVIHYSKEAEILRIENKVHFAGKNLYLDYTTEK